MKIGLTFGETNKTDIQRLQTKFKIFELKVQIHLVNYLLFEGKEKV
jgi:hypothetical protein